MVNAIFLYDNAINMSGEIILQRVLHPDPHGNRQDNFEYARSQYQQRLVEEGLDSSPIIQVAFQVADNYQDRLLAERRWARFDLGDYGTDMNVASHQHRQSYLADISAGLDWIPPLERVLVNAGSSIHDIGEAGIIEGTDQTVSDIPKPIKMRDPRKYEVLEASAALKMIQDTNLDQQEKEALMEVYWRLITSTITPDEYTEMSGAKIGAWPETLNWAQAKDGFEISEFYGYKLTAVQQLYFLKNPVSLTPEESYRAASWTDRDVINMQEEDDPRVRERLFLSENMRRLFLYKCGWVKQILEGCKDGRPSALFFAEKFYQEMRVGQQTLDLGINLSDVCPGFEELGQVLSQ